MCWDGEAGQVKIGDWEEVVGLDGGGVGGDRDLMS
jgi:hypothetical protein